MEAGSSLPAGYNPDQSLLNVGQNAPILAIRGGGQDGGEGEVFYDKYVVEQYDPPLVSIPIPKLPTAEGQKSAVQAYITFSKPFVNELKSFIADPAPYRSTGQDNPTYQICPTPGGRRRLPTNFFQGVRKRVVIITHDNPHIWLIHNLQGNISKFLQYMKLIPQGKDGALDPNHYVFLTGSIFSDDITNNLNFYHQFLLVKQKNMEHFYSINDLSEKFVNTSCSIMTNIYSPVYLSKEGMRNTVFTFNEPDIVIFKKQHIVFKNSELPIQRDEMTINLSTILEKPDEEGKYKSFLIVPLVGANEEFASNSSDAPSAKKYFILDFNANTPKKIAFPATSDLTCPKDQTCSNFKGGYSLPKLSDDKRFDLTGVFHIYKNEDKMPFLKAPGSKLEEEKQEETKEEEEEKTEEEEGEPVKELDVEPEMDEDLKKLLAEKPMEFKRKLPDEPFKEDPSTVQGKEQDIELNAIIFRLRIPLDKTVREDWTHGKFTKNEVEFLHALRFTPQLLADTFGKNAWKMRLATFLESLLLSNCFQDTSLLMKLECSNAQYFVKQVYFQMYKRVLGDLYDEMGIVKPKTLADVFAGLRGLGPIGPPRGLYPIGKHDYTGDLLERFQTIHFNKKTGEYYTDFAKMTDATRDILQKMKLYRVEDKDIEEITKAILERMKIPVPSKPTGSSPQAPPSPPPPPPPSPKPTTEQCDVIQKYIRNTIETTFMEDKLIEFVNTSVEAKTKGVTLDIFKQCLADINKEIGSEYFKIEVDTSKKGQILSENDYEIKNVPSDGWCFYHALLQSVGPAPNYSSQTVDEIKADTSTDAEVMTFIGKLQTAIEASPEKADWERKYDIIYGKGTYGPYVKSLDSAKQKPWADPDFGIGQTAANELKANIEVYRQFGPEFSLIVTYPTSVQTAPGSVIRLNYINNNHYQILLKKQAGGQIEELIELGEAVEEVLDLGEALPNNEKKRYRKRTLRNKNRKNRQTKKHRK